MRAADRLPPFEARHQNAVPAHMTCCREGNALACTSSTRILSTRTKRPGYTGAFYLPVLRNINFLATPIAVLYGNGRNCSIGRLRECPHPSDKAYNSGSPKFYHEFNMILSCPIESVNCPVKHKCGETVKYVLRSFTRSSFPDIIYRRYSALLVTQS